MGFVLLIAVEATVPKADYDALEVKYIELEYNFEQLLKLIKGFKSERFQPTASHADQGELFETDSPPDEPVATEQIAYERKKRSGRSDVRKLPDHLPVEEHILEPEADTTGLKRIGQEVTDTLDYRPGRLVIIRRIRPKYVQVTSTEAGDQTCRVLIAPLPSRPIERGLAEPGLLAQLCVDKYVDHLPLYRQAQRFARDFKWKVAESTLNDWFAAVCRLLEPLYQDLIAAVVDTDYLQVDESTIRVLDKQKKGSTHLGYMWVYHNPLKRIAFFDYRRGRDAGGLEARLPQFTGYLQSDGYTAYTKYLGKHPEAEGVSCSAHIRRDFHDALTNNRPKAEHVLREFQKIYKVEAHCRQRGRSAEQRLALRKRVSKLVYDSLVQWVNAERADNLSKGAYAEALRYAQNQLPKLAALFRDGRIEIDNNLIENLIRLLALGRKNYLFAGSHTGAERAAMMYSFFASCKKHDVNPREWLSDVLGRIMDHPRPSLSELLPNNWKQARKA